MVGPLFPHGLIKMELACAANEVEAQEKAGIDVELTRDPDVLIRSHQTANWDLGYFMTIRSATIFSNLHVGDGAGYFILLLLLE